MEQFLFKVKENDKGYSLDLLYVKLDSVQVMSSWSALTILWHQYHDLMSSFLQLKSKK